MPNNPEPITAELRGMAEAALVMKRADSAAMFVAAADIIESLSARLAQAEQERDAVIFLRGARAKAVAEGYAQGRGDTLAQVKALIDPLCGRSLSGAEVLSVLIAKLDALPVSPPQETTEKERA